MFRRRSTTPHSTDASAYSRRAAVADSVWATQDRARSGLGQALQALGRAFDRLAFPLQERVVWPLADRFDSAGGAGRALSTSALILVAAAAGVAGLAWAAPDGPHEAAPATEVAASAAPFASAKATAADAAGPTLHGAAPVFKPTAKQAAAELDPAKAIVKSTPADSAADEAATADSSATASAAAGEPAARAAAVEGPPAGPAAVSVARDFSTAFVVYETGGSDAGVRRAFAATATPELTKALLRRPPRLPANVKVPKAKVLNVVAGPSHDKVYPVSVSLLRVGLTSELRLEMERLKGEGWRVTNVLG